MKAEISRIGQRGTIVIPSSIRKQFGLKDGSYVTTEAREDGLLIRPVSVVPLEIYSDRRKAEFLLNNAVDADEYRKAVQAVRDMGLNPRDIPHGKPSRRK